LAQGFILVLLGLLQALGSGGEATGGVGHAGVQPELVEVVTQVVVLHDVAAAAVFGVATQEMADAVGQLQQTHADEALGGASELGIGMKINDEPSQGAAHIRAVPEAIGVGLAKADSAKEGAVFEELFVVDDDASCGLAGAKDFHFALWELHAESPDSEAAEDAEHGPAVDAGASVTGVELGCHGVVMAWFERLEWGRYKWVWSSG
jgi:hypothetical protein